MSGPVPETPAAAVRAVMQALGYLNTRARCKGSTCAAWVYYAKTVNGATAVIDAELGVSHFATCPDRHEFRRGHTPQKKDR